MPDSQPDSGENTQTFTPEFTGAFTAAAVHDRPTEIPPHPAQPVVVPGVTQYLGRWRFVLVLCAVWLVAAAAGAGLYYWWFHSHDKTMPVFVVLVFLVAATVGSLLTALVQERPVVAALAIALMSAPMAAVAGAALLYGGYVFGWVSR
ncbi:hypothetical protein ACAG25_09715 [Mycobacterium sp. pV006]|uniref:hypothetical protein n=1 Tax=Mycobacterium sp. pV006 TaxID=3238983 RepID=UPI00351AC494